MPFLFFCCYFGFITHVQQATAAGFVFIISLPDAIRYETCKHFSIKIDASEMNQPIMKDRTIIYSSMEWLALRYLLSADRISL